MGRQGLYANPVVYDILYTSGTAGEIGAFIELEMQFAPGRILKGSLWFEPACGTGRYLRDLQKREKRIAGFDLDEGQLDYARGRGVEEVWGTILADNHRMLGLAKALGFRLRRDPDEPDAVLAVKRLDAAA